MFSQRLRGTMVMVAVVTAGLTGFTPATASAQGTHTAHAAQTGPVSPVPENGTPELAKTGSTEKVRQLIQCGGTMYAVGKFTEISQNGVTHQVSNAFSFRATAPFTLTNWLPQVNGEVNSIAFVGGNCTHAYLGGDFTSIAGFAVQNIAEVSTVTGQVVPGFAHAASKEVETLLGYQGHLIVGGWFTKINGSSDAYMVSLNPATGHSDGLIDLGIRGHYTTPGLDVNSTKVYNQQLSPSGSLDLVEGDFTTVAGQPRQQIFMLNLATDPATLTGWTSSDFDQACYSEHPFYVTAAAWSPSSSTVYIATTGYHPLDWNGSFPLTGLCDVAAAFPATQTEVSPLWINYTGCWSLYSVAADSSAVYVGGHEEYANNPGGCKHPGPGAVSAPGLGGLNPATGQVLLNAQGTAGRYSRGRGRGADDMLLTSAGLWIASDNFDNVLSNQCGNVHQHAGICFLPYG